MFENKRILVVDDNESIHDDFKKILSNARTPDDEEYLNLENELFEIDRKLPNNTFNYQIDSAYQGQDALDMADRAEEEGNQYALMFVDVRMPPGWDGIETIARIWEKYPGIEMVICSAYSDYSWEKIIEKLGMNDKLLFLKKPFDSIEVQQMVLSLTKKWYLTKKLNHYVNNLEKEVSERTKQLKSMVQELVNSRDKLKREVFARQMADDSLSKERESLFVTLNNIYDAVIGTDIKGSITIVNKSAETMTGYKSSEAVLHHISEILNLYDKQHKKVEIWNESGYANFSYDKTYLLKSRNGDERSVIVKSSPVSDKITSKIIGNVFIVRDYINENLLTKKNENRLSLLNKLTSNTASLLKKLASEPEHNTKIKENLKKTYLAMEIVSAYTGNSFQPEKINFGEMLKSELKQSDREVKFNIQQDFYILTDKVTFSKLLAYLSAFISGLNNPEIALLEVAENAGAINENRYLALTFKADNIAAAFEYYGLSEMENLETVLQIFDGKLVNESTESFSVLLPFAPVLKPDTARNIRNILVVNDEEILVNILKKILEELGYKVTMADNLKSSFNTYTRAIYSGSPFSAVIIDSSIISASDTEEILKMFTEAEPEVNLILSTDNSNTSKIERFNKNLFKRILVKPFRIQELNRLLEEIINN